MIPKKYNSDVAKNFYAEKITFSKSFIIILNKSEGDKKYVIKK